MNKLKIGIVGFGWFGRKHFNVWKTIDFVEVVGIADKEIDSIVRGRKKFLQGEFHVENKHETPDLVNIPLYKSIEDLLKHENVDVIDIVTDESNHYPVAKYALEHGKDIIVEKPFVTQYKHALELKKVANKNGCKIFVGHILRFDRRIRYIRDLINMGKIGEIRYLSFKRNFQPQAHLVYGRTNPFLSAMTHDIDLALWFTGRKIVNMYSKAKYLLKRKTPDVLVAILEFENDVIARIENVWHVAKSCPYGFENEIAIYGSKSTVIQSNVPVIKVWSDGKVEYPELFFWPVIEGEVEGALKDELAHFAKCILNREDSPVVPLDDVIESIRVAEELINISKGE